jgi:hypothetical protein
MSHKNAPEGQRHPAHNYSYSGAVARRDAGPFAADELYTMALQIDDFSTWRLIQIAPPVWDPTQGATLLHAVMEDEFFGKALGAQWDKVLQGALSHAELINEPGSALRLRADFSVAGDHAEIDLGNNRPFKANGQAEFRARVQLQQLTDTFFEIGFRKTTTDAILFRYKSSVSANWYRVTKSASTETAEDTGIAATTAWTDLLLESEAGKVRFCIDMASAGTVTTNVPTVSQEMVARCENEAAVALKETYLDFVRAEMSR